MQEVQLRRFVGVRFWPQLSGPLPPGVLRSGILVFEKQTSVRAITHHSSLAWIGGLRRTSPSCVCGTAVAPPTSWGKVGWT